MTTWHVFGPGHPLPPERHHVLVQIEGEERAGHAPAVALGYLRFAAGDPNSAYFVVPGFGRPFNVTHWTDVLPEDLDPPLWTAVTRLSPRTIGEKKEE